MIAFAVALTAASALLGILWWLADDAGWWDWRQAALGLAAATIGGAAMVVWTFVGAIAMERRACDIVEAETGHVTFFEFPAGCFITIDGETIPLERWISVDERSGE